MTSKQTAHSRFGRLFMWLSTQSAERRLLWGPVAAIVLAISPINIANKMGLVQENLGNSTAMMLHMIALVLDLATMAALILGIFAQSLNRTRKDINRREGNPETQPISFRQWTANWRR